MFNKSSARGHKLNCKVNLQKTLQTWQFIFEILMKGYSCIFLKHILKLNNIYPKNPPVEVVSSVCQMFLQSLMNQPIELPAVFVTTLLSSCYSAELSNVTDVFGSLTFFIL